VSGTLRGAGESRRRTVLPCPASQLALTYPNVWITGNCAALPCVGCVSCFSITASAHTQQHASTCTHVHTRAHTHTHTRARLVLRWTKNRPVAETQHSQETDIHVFGGIWTHSASTRATAAQRATTGMGGNWIKKSNRNGRKRPWPDLNLLNFDGPIDNWLVCEMCLRWTIFWISYYKYDDKYTWCSYFTLHPSLVNVHTAPHLTSAISLPRSRYRNIPMFELVVLRTATSNAVTVHIRVHHFLHLQWKNIHSTERLDPLAYPEGGFGGFKPPPPPKLFRSLDKVEPNSQFRGKYILRT
jgi:hypothetical protein